jgi:hypothetical protein
VKIDAMHYSICSSKLPAGLWLPSKTTTVTAISAPTGAESLARRCHVVLHDRENPL